MSKYVIWEELLSEEDVREIMSDYRDNPEYAGMSEDELRRFVADLNHDYLEDEKRDLSGVETPNGLVITGIIQRWNETRFGALPPDKTPGTISECLRGFCDSESYLTIYVEDGELWIREAHHDGTNLYLVRAWRPDVNDDQKDDFWEDFYKHNGVSKRIDSMTFRVGDLIGDVYGWEFPDRPACSVRQQNAI